MIVRQNNCTKQGNAFYKINLLNYNITSQYSGAKTIQPVMDICWFLCFQSELSERMAS